MVAKALRGLTWSEKNGRKRIKQQFWPLSLSLNRSNNISIVIFFPKRYITHSVFFRRGVWSDRRHSKPLRSNVVAKSPDLEFEKEEMNISFKFFFPFAFLQLKKPFFASRKATVAIFQKLKKMLLRNKSYFPHSV